MGKIVKNTSEWVEEVLALINDEKYQEKMKQAGVNVVIKGAPDYPKVLMQYKEAPEFLFYKGNLPDPKKAPVPKTANVGVSPSNAPKMAYESIPLANPLMTCTPALDKSLPMSFAIFLP